MEFQMKLYLKVLGTAVLLTSITTGCGGSSSSTKEDIPMTEIENDVPEIVKESDSSAQNENPDQQMPPVMEIEIEPDPILTLANFLPRVDITIPAQIASPGQGFEEDFSVSKERNCLKGEIQSTDITEVLIQNNSEFSMRELTELFQLKGVVGVPSIFGAEASILHAIEETDRSINAVGVYSINAEKGTFILNEEDPLTSFAKDILQKSGPLGLRKYCGNQYIKEVKKGARFIVSVKFSFNSREMKQEFKAKASGSIAEFIPVKAAMNVYRKDFKQSGSYSVYAYQKGGDSSAVSNAFQFGNNNSILKCRISNEDCLAIGDKIHDYIISDELRNWMQSGTYEIVDVTYGFLENILPPTVFTDEAASSYLSPDLIAMRSSLNMEIINRVKTLDLIKIETSNYGSASLEEKERLQTWYNRLSANQEIINSDLLSLNSAFVTCYNDVTNCLSVGQENIKQLTEIPVVEHKRIWKDTGSHFSRGDMEIFCQAPSWSFINRIDYASIYNEALIGYYPIDPETGQLGEISYRYCSSEGTFDRYHALQVPHKSVILPENYGVTEIIQYTDSHILASMALKGKRWNSSMFSLAGDSIVRSDGGLANEGSATVPDYQMAYGVRLAEQNSSSQYTVLRGASIQ
jgi:hypothetical protein